VVISNQTCAFFKDSGIAERNAIDKMLACGEMPSAITEAMSGTNSGARSRLIRQARYLHGKAESAARKGRYREALRRHQEAAETLQALLNDVVRLEAARSERVRSELTQREERLLGGGHRSRIEAIGVRLREMRAGRRAVNRSSSEPPHTASPSSPEDYGFSQLRPHSRGGNAPMNKGILKKDSKSKKDSAGKRFR